MIKIPSVEQLLDAGVHFGHRTNKWNPKMTPYIYGERNGIHIINLSKTVSKLQQALRKLGELSKEGEVLFVATKRQAREIVQSETERVGMHYVINRWPGGLLTNFKVQSVGIKKLLALEEELASGVENRTKQEVVWMKRDMERLERLYGGVKFLRAMPSVIVVIDPKAERNAMNEAKKMRIPVIGIVDTNCDPDSVDYAIPSNDDALKSINLLVRSLSSAVEDSKGPSVTLFNMRKSHLENLERLRREAAVKAEMRAKAETLKKEEIKALKEGRVSVTESETGAKTVRTSATPIVKKIEKEQVKEEKKQKVKKREDSSELSKLKLTKRTLDSLEKAGIVKIDALKKMSDEDLLKIQGFGPKSLEEIKKSF